MTYHISLDLDFRRNPYPGRYIAIEGVDGSGKTTQVEQLKTHFEKQGKDVIVTQEPTREGIIGRMIHEVLQAEIKIPSVALQYIFSADRTVNHATKILPALKEGKIVLSSRCFWSAIPYGILDREEAISDNAAYTIMVAQGILSMYHQFTLPDHTFYLEISVDLAMQRIAQMGKQTEIYERREKIEKIKSGYDWLLKNFPKEITVIDGLQPIEKVTEEIIAHIKR